MQKIIDILNTFDPISLKEMEAEMLMRRFDFKFKFHIDDLPAFLNEVSKDYRILEINHLKLHKYESLYYDTEEFALFLQHQRVLRGRYKIRFRRYADSNLVFFEIKLKTNKNKIIKERILQKCVEQEIKDDTGLFISKKMNMPPELFLPKLWVYYYRMTLVSKKDEERITIDVELSFKMNNGVKEIAFPSLVLAEVKQRKFFRSPFVAVMRDHHLRREPISKYCTGVALMQENIKQNHFKYNLLSIKKICHEQN